MRWHKGWETMLTRRGIRKSLNDVKYKSRVLEKTLQLGYRKGRSFKYYVNNRNTPLCLAFSIYTKHI